VISSRPAIPVGALDGTFAGDGADFMAFPVGKRDRWLPRDKARSKRVCDRGRGSGRLARRMLGIASRE
jgi:hypothetical protein